MKIYTENIKKDFTCKRKSLYNGYQLLFSFSNSFGASVIKHDWSKGLEIAVLDSEGSITYDTPITSDTLGHLSNDEANEILERISKL